MRLTYETGVATLIQFISLSFLNIASTVSSIITTCHHDDSSECVTNMLASIVFYLVIVAMFGAIAAVGYQAQIKRSKRAARLLILSELAVFVVAAYNIKLGLANHSNAISLFTSLIDTILAVWVISLAFRLMRARGGRVVTRNRVRHHHNPTEL